MFCELLNHDTISRGLPLEQILIILRALPLEYDTILRGSLLEHDTILRGLPLGHDIILLGLPLEHVVEHLAEVLAAEALVLHLLVIVHLAFRDFPVVELVPTRAQLPVPNPAREILIHYIKYWCAAPNTSRSPSSKLKVLHEEDFVFVCSKPWKPLSM